MAGRGLEGDRHTDGKGTFPSGMPGSALTLIEAEVCESFDPPLEANEHRRNLVTRGIDLNRLLGHEFLVGSVRCRGMSHAGWSIAMHRVPFCARSCTVAACAPTSSRTVSCASATKSDRSADS